MGVSVDKAGRVRCQGLQVAAQRVVVRRAVSDPAHSAAAEIAPVVRSEIGAVSLQAVYGARATLSGRAIIGGIQTAGSAARYEDRVDNNHHHLIWRSCSQVVDVDCAVGRTSCLTAAEDSGREIDEAEVIDWAVARLRRGGCCLVRRVIGGRTAEEARYASCGCAERQLEQTIIGTKQ